MGMDEQWKEEKRESVEGVRTGSQSMSRGRISPGRLGKG